MFRANMVANLWDLADEGLESALEFLQSDLGVGGVCAAATCGPGRHLRFGPEASPRVFETRGGVCFLPESKFYQDTRCKPSPAEWLRGRDLLARLSAHCTKRGLGLRAVIDCTNIGRIVTADARFARKNVFGDVPGRQVCLINPDVAEFVCALVHDLHQTYALESIELSGLDAMDEPAERTGDSIGTGATQLLALCFCESCKQLATEAGVDVAGAARSTSVRLETLFRDGQRIEVPVAKLAADDPPLSAFTAWYVERIASLVERIHERSSREVCLHVGLRGDGAEAGTASGYARGAGAVIGDLSRWDADLADRALATLREAVGAARRLELQFPVWTPDTGTAQAGVRALAYVAEQGIASVNLNHLGRLPRGCAEAVRQAIRFAGRTGA
ncbi:MAG: hypothetical protein GY842_21345 [bacterium]|nr:hypothetical protein [bacterium]